MVGFWISLKGGTISIYTVIDIDMDMDMDMENVYICEKKKKVGN